MSLPLDDNILLSLVNTCLRDGGSLDDFCAEYGEEEGALVSRLKSAGYEFDGKSNSFKGV